MTKEIKSLWRSGIVELKLLGRPHCRGLFCWQVARRFSGWPALLAVLHPAQIGLAKTIALGESGSETQPAGALID